MGSKVIVFGGGGFLGSHTADELSRQGYDVTIFDNAPSRWLRDGQEMIVGDVTDRDAVIESVKGMDYIYHFAGVSDIGAADQSPFATIEANVMGTTTILQAAVDANVRRLIFASTMYVYSDRGSFYRASKQATEIIIEAYQEKFDLDYTLLRYGSLYGPRAQDWNGLKRFVRQVVQEGVLDYNGTGKERREYIHVNDAARLSVEILDEAHKNQAITVTGHQVLNSTELLRMIFEIAGKPENIRMSNRETNGDHYVMTPYRYKPITARKIIPGEYIDLGQGILDVVAEIHQELAGDRD
ncbi:MAG: NAD-dependent epimerase/dehydratase family protein [Paracoccaceae bacterium]|nr:NAD-dependent epimerase/dehydratase family protein [Paracoccaceae bacterium]MDG2258384.1 NAD-dependent epimerase/dehydratase family protein [Paracoccaceae bacterium]